MFRPNLIGTLRKKVSRDVRGRVTYGPDTPCPFAIVNLDIGALKTSVRADSSASRGSADETVAQRAVILISPLSDVSVSDQFEFEDMTFEVSSKHVRRTVMGSIDHFQCDLEILP